MASTAIPGVKAAIESILADAEGLEEVLTTTEYAKTEKQRESIWIWKAKAKRIPKGIGRRPLKLAEDIRVTLRVLVIGGKAAEVEARVFDLVEHAETALSDEIRLAGSVTLFSHVEELEDEPLIFDNKVGHHVLMTVVGKTRI